MIPLPLPKAKPPHPLARFVTKQAVALLLKRKPEDIFEIRYWAHVMLVRGVGFCLFVSYADMPPILGVEPPTAEDFLRWCKRWKKNKQQAPDFWVQFYTQKFRKTRSVEELYMWGQLVGVIKYALPQDGVESLRSVYFEEKWILENF